MSQASAIKQNFHEDSEKAINKQINLELTASYVYQTMAMHYDRDDVALPGFSSFFKQDAVEEREHAEKLMNYLNKRGGRIVFEDVKRPVSYAWGNGMQGLQAALALEKQVNQSLLDLHVVASANNDAHLTDFLEQEFLDDQVKTIKELSNLITNLKRAGQEGLGEYLFDKDLMK